MIYILITIQTILVFMLILVLVCFYILFKLILSLAYTQDSAKTLKQNITSLVASKNKVKSVFKYKGREEVRREKELGARNEVLQKIIDGEPIDDSDKEKVLSIGEMIKQQLESK